MQYTGTVTLLLIFIALFPFVIWQWSFRVRSIIWKPFKTLSWNFIVIYCIIRQRADDKNCNSWLFICLSVILLQIRIRSISWKQLKVLSWNFIEIHSIVRQRADYKNHNSCLYSFGVIRLINLTVVVACSSINKNRSGYFRKLHRNIKHHPTTRRRQ